MCRIWLTLISSFSVNSKMMFYKGNPVSIAAARVTLMQARGS